MIRATDMQDWGDMVALRERALDVIPGGSSTGSKRPEALYGQHANDTRLPAHYERASGCTIITPDGRSYIDCTMALGAVAIGYGDPAITRAVTDAAVQGNVSGLPHRLEVEVAERLVEVIPCAEQVRFLRTGAEAVAAAVRIARAYTGRERIVACGYFGWLDWCSDAVGVPDTVRSMVTWVPYGDAGALERAFDEQSVPAAVIIEPMVHDIAPRDWLVAARELCNRTGAILVFDEVKTAFRFRIGGIQQLHDVLPDLCTLGKAMANGYPLAAVAGRADVMAAAARTWISSTAAAESTGLAAARGVLEWFDRVDVPDRLLAAGSTLRDTVHAALDTASTGLSVEGPPQMFRLVEEREGPLDNFVRAAVHHGVLLKRGAYQFVSLAHDEGVLEQLSQRLRAAAIDVSMQRSNWNE